MSETEDDVRLSRDLARKLYPLILTMGLIIALGIPGVFAFLEYREIRTVAGQYARELAADLVELAYEHQTLWKYPAQKYGLIAKRFVFLKGELVIYIRDDAGSMVNLDKHHFQQDEERGEWLPLVFGDAAPVLFNRKQIGTVTIGLPMRSLVLNTISFLVISSFAGILLGALAYRFPIGVVSRQEGEILELVASLRESHAELELRVQERTAELREANETLMEEVAFRRHTEEELLIEIRDRKRAEDALRESEERFRQIAENISQVFWMANLEFTEMLYISPACEVMMGLSCQSLYENSKSWFDAIHPEDVERVIRTVKERDTGEHLMEYRVVLPDGTVRLLLDHSFPIHNESGEVYRFAGIVEDITQRKLAEAQIHASLQEKDVLLREIYHRVKNNLQVISSLLSLQARPIKDKNVAACFLESQARIDSMALIHEKLYRSKDLARIDFREYVPELLGNLFISFGAEAARIQRKITVEDVQLGIDTAIPLGLIINETVSNCLKHAFPPAAICGKPGGPECEIAVDLRSSDGNNYLLTISDNGVGLPKGFGFHDSTRLGMKLVNTLVDQLDGTIVFESQVGTQVKIAFTELKYRERR